MGGFRLYVVEVPGRYDGTYIFAQREQAEAFAALVGEPVSEEVLIHGECAELLIASEADGADEPLPPTNQGKFKP